MLSNKYKILLDRNFNIIRSLKLIGTVINIELQVILKIENKYILLINLVKIKI